jgi:hypothetical protein
MAEIVEYCLVVMVSTLFVAGAVVAYSSFASFEAGIQLRAESASVSALVSQAAQNGSARASLSLPASVISCAPGALTIASSSGTVTLTPPTTCGFEVSLAGGLHTLRFSTNSSKLSLSVT